jgi:hypothetical protein
MGFGSKCCGVRDKNDWSDPRENGCANNLIILNILSMLRDFPGNSRVFNIVQDDQMSMLPSTSSGQGRRLSVGRS